MQNNKSIDRRLTIFWFRQDLRISDNPGLFEAAQRGEVMPVYIFDDDALRLGSASKWWLQKSLESLNKDLSGKLNVYLGNAKEVLAKLASEHDVSAVYWSRCYEQWRRQEDGEIPELLSSRGIECKSFNASLIWEPQEVLKSDGSSYKVFTPFYQSCIKKGLPREPLPKPDKLALMRDEKAMSGINFEQQLNLDWKVGEQAAADRLMEFLDEGLCRYKDGRNFPAQLNVSRLSPYLRFGEISPNQVWVSVVTKGMIESWAGDLECFAKELVWREFSYYLLYHFPDLPRKNYQAKFDDFRWRYDDALLKAWQNGQTGYPLVDAGMRELLQTGYMHNRVRMVVASFLTKNLLMDWQIGAEWFWDKLVDADTANNSASWQWVAGSGADAAPYFRIFNPTAQGEKFDPNGAYTRRFVPELASLPDKYLFKPWEAPDDVLKAAGITLGKTYPKPIVELSTSRAAALTAYHLISRGIAT